MTDKKDLPYKKIGFFKGVKTKSIRLKMNRLKWIEGHKLLNGDYVSSHWQNCIFAENAKEDLNPVPIKCHWYKMSKRMIYNLDVVNIEVQRRKIDNKDIIIFNIYPEKNLSQPSCRLKFIPRKEKGIYIAGAKNKFYFEAL